MAKPVHTYNIIRMSHTTFSIFHSTWHKILESSNGRTSQSYQRHILNWIIIILDKYAHCPIYQTVNKLVRYERYIKVEGVTERACLSSLHDCTGTWLTMFMKSFMNLYNLKAWIEKSKKYYIETRTCQAAWIVSGPMHDLTARVELISAHKSPISISSSLSSQLHLNN